MRDYRQFLYLPPFASSTAPIVQIPQAVYEGYRRRRTDPDRLSLEQFQIFIAAYSWANWNDWRVSSYSAARVCEFWGLDSSEANIKRFERHAANLLNRCLVRRDYRRGTERTYSLWLPNPRRFDRIRTAEENGVSLWKADVGVLVGDNVGVQEVPSSKDTRDYEQQETDNVGVDVGDSALQLSITYQEHQENREREPLNPLRGLDHPPAPPVGGERSPLGSAQTPLGLEKPHREDKTTRSLSAEQWEAFSSIVKDFQLAWVKAFKFEPDTQALRDLLRKFSPWEICAACIGLGLAVGKSKANKITSVFFDRTAAVAISQRRALDKEFVLDDDKEFVLADANWTAFESFDSIQKKWCALFGQELPFRFWLDWSQQSHFYHPGLKQLLSTWKSDLQRAEAAEQAKTAAEAAKIRAEQERVAAEERQKLQEQQKREAAEQQKQLAEQREREFTERQKQLVEQQKQAREDARDRLKQYFSAPHFAKWTFDGGDTWTTPYNATVRLDDTGRTATITDSKGKSKTYSTGDLAELAHRAVAAD